MKHLGDITKINWFEVEPVDVVTGGSPCQDLSVAGKRAGLAGERSGLYMEQIRCVKELRQADVHRGRSGQFIRPRYMVWENVPGAFSSGSPKGSDFAAVIEELIKVAEPDAEVRVLPPSDGWTKSGCYYDCDGRWSIAWRVHDAQFWGVPQRRKRIALVADFGGLSAPEVLFERKGLSGDFEPCGTEREETAGAVGSGAGGAISFQERAGKPGGGKGILIQPERTGALSTLNNQSVFVDVYNQEITGDVAASITAACGGTNTSGAKVMCYGISAYESNAMKSSNPHSGIYEADTSRTLDLNGGNPACNQGGMAVVNTYQDVTGPLMANSHPGSYTGQDAYSDMLVTAVDCRNGYENNNLSGTIQAKENGGHSLNYINPIRFANEVRRLTPLECERLQGYPDGWTLIGEPEEVEVKDYATVLVPGEGCKYKSEHEAFEEWIATAEVDDDGELVDGFNAKDFGFVSRKIFVGTHKEIQYFYRDENGKKKRCADSARYKALGNSIALPFWKRLAKRISAQYDRDITMGSLFDGISGFPLSFLEAGGKPLWTSEVEEFPIAVCKRHFGDEETGEKGDVWKFLSR